MDADKIFSSFFGTDHRGSNFQMVFGDNDDFSFGSGLFERLGGSRQSFGASRQGSSGDPMKSFSPSVPKQYQIDLVLTLEELYL